MMSRKKKQIELFGFAGIARLAHMTRNHVRMDYVRGKLPDPFALLDQGRDKEGIPVWTREQIDPYVAERLGKKQTASE